MNNRQQVQKRYAETHKEQLSEYQASYYQAHKEELRLKRQEYRNANKEKVQQWNRTNYLKRKEKNCNGETIDGTKQQ